jgi:hypothetical protein
LGRTNPTYRNFLSSFEQNWQKYRRGMRNGDREYFDRVTEKARKQAHAASYMNHSNPVIPMLVSVLVEQQKQIDRLEEELDVQG